MMGYHKRPLPPVWNSENDMEMCWRIRESGMPLDEDDARLVRHLFDECETSPSVYDLHRLNMLCHQAIGYVKGLEWARRIDSAKR